MVIVINCLILFFIVLVSYQIYFKYFKTGIREGMTDTSDPAYINYDKKIADNALILAQQNAGNIEYLKQRINDIQDMADEVNQLSSNVDSLQQQVSGLVQANTQYTSQNIGTTPPDISGAVEDNTAPSSANFVTDD